jgi:hypothetical protein
MGRKPSTLFGSLSGRPLAERDAVRFVTAPTAATHFFLTGLAIDTRAHVRTDANRWSNDRPMRSYRALHASVESVSIFKSMRRHRSANGTRAIPTAQP